MSAALYSEVIEKGTSPQTRKILLAEACERKLYNALVFMCDANFKVVEACFSAGDSKSYALGENALKRLIIDLETLSDTYWSIGYVVAGAKFIELSHLFKALETINPVQADHFKSRSESYMMRGATDVIVGHKLQDRPESHAIIKDITNGKDLLSILKNPEKYKDWPTTLTNLNGSMKRDDFNFAESQAAKKKIELLTRFEYLKANKKQSCSSNYSLKMFDGSVQSPQKDNTPTNIETSLHKI